MIYVVITGLGMMPHTYNLLFLICSYFNDSPPFTIHWFLWLMRTLSPSFLMTQMEVAVIIRLKK